MNCEWCVNKSSDGTDMQYYRVKLYNHTYHCLCDSCYNRLLKDADGYLLDKLEVEPYAR